MKPTFFATPAAFRRWLAKHHEAKTELWVGFHKRATGRPSLTWPESVDEALCFGWIDGVRKSIDENAYVVRFTPRRAASNWSVVNVARVRELIRTKRMSARGLAAFAARQERKTGVYSFENQPKTLAPAYAKAMKANRAAWEWFEARAPWYRRVATFWVMSAKQEETRLRRLAILIESSAQGRNVPPLVRPVGKKSAANRSAAKKKPAGKKIAARKTSASRSPRASSRRA